MHKTSNSSTYLKTHKFPFLKSNEVPIRKAEIYTYPTVPEATSGVGAGEGAGAGVTEAGLQRKLIDSSV